MYSKYVQSYAIFWHLPIYFPHAESDFFLNMGVTYFFNHNYDRLSHNKQCDSQPRNPVNVVKRLK